MAIPSAVGDLLEVKFFCYTTDQIGVNVRHYLVSAITGDGGLSDAIVSWDSVMAPLYKAMLSATARYRGMSIQRILPVPSATVTSVANDGAGLSGGNVLPHQTSGFISLGTPFSGRKEHARMYIPFPSQGVNDADGTPLALYVTGMEAIGDQILDDGPYVNGLNGVTVIPVVFSRATGEIRQLTRRSCPKKWATQRRRGEFGQLNPIPL